MLAWSRIMSEGPQRYSVAPQRASDAESETGNDLQSPLDNIRNEEQTIESQTNGSKPVYSSEEKAVA